MPTKFPSRLLSASCQINWATRFRNLTAGGSGSGKSLELATAVLLVLKHTDGNGLGHTGEREKSGKFHGYLLETAGSEEGCVIGYIVLRSKSIYLFSRDNLPFSTLS